MVVIALGTTLRMAGVTLFALMLAAGGTLAGTVHTICDCTPDTSDGFPFSYCVCTSSQGLGALDTNEYRRNCTNSEAKYSTYPTPWCAASSNFPGGMVGPIPKNMTCTQPEGAGNYYYNDCTNWNLSSRHITVYTYCTNDSNYGPL